MMSSMMGKTLTLSRVTAVCVGVPIFIRRLLLFRKHNLFCSPQYVFKFRWSSCITPASCCPHRSTLHTPSARLTGMPG